MANIKTFKDKAWLATRIEDIQDNKVEVKDSTGKLRYTVICPTYRDGDKYKVAKSDISLADITDNCDVKCSTSMDLYGFGTGDWLLGIKKRHSGKQLKARPYALTKWNHTSESNPKPTDIIDGIYEYARSASSVKHKDESTISVSGIFDNADIIPKLDSGLLTVRHRLYKEVYSKQYNTYGTIWEVEGSAEEFLLNFEADRDSVVPTYLVPFTYEGHNYFCEYFDKLLFLDFDPNVIGITDIEHNYTTPSNLSEDTIWTAGTYYISSSVSIGNYDLTLDASAGNIYIKYNSGYTYIYINGSGRFTTSNTSSTNKVIITSKNDDAHGETITGSSGSPACGDYIKPLSIGTSIPTSFTLDWFEFWYYGAGTTYYTAALAISTATNTDVSLTNGIFKHCSMSLNGYTGIIGNHPGTTFYYVKSLELDNIRIDNTNDCPAHKYANHLIFFSPTPSGSYKIKNLFVDMPAATAPTDNLIVIRAKDLGSGAFIELENVFINTRTAYSASSSTVYVYSVHTNNTSIAVGVKHCTLINDVNTSGYGLYNYGYAAHDQCYFKDSIVVNYKNVVNYDTKLPHNNNVFYNSESLGAGFVLDSTEITGVNPNFGNLSFEGAEQQVSGSIPFDNGYAATNIGVQESGSATYDDSGLDETKYTPNGTIYAGTDYITPGIYYEYFSPSPANITHSGIAIELLPLDHVVGIGAAWTPGKYEEFPLDPDNPEFIGLFDVQCEPLSHTVDIIYPNMYYLGEGTTGDKSGLHKDTTVISGFFQNNAYGGDVQLAAGSDGWTSIYSLLRFNLSGVVGSVGSANLALTVTQPPWMLDPVQYLYVMKTPWGVSATDEGVSEEHADGGKPTFQFSNQYIVDFAPTGVAWAAGSGLGIQDIYYPTTISSVVPMLTPSGTVINFDVTTAIASMVSGDLDNAGFVLSSIGDFVFYASQENGVSGHRPLLTIGSKSSDPVNVLHSGISLELVSFSHNVGTSALAQQSVKTIEFFKNSSAIYTGVNYTPSVNSVELLPLTHAAKTAANIPHAAQIIELDPLGGTASIGAAHSQSANIIELLTQSHQTGTGGGYSVSTAIVEVVGLSHAQAGGASTSRTVSVVELSTLNSTAGTGARAIQSISTIELETQSHTPRTGGGVSSSPSIVEFLGLTHQAAGGASVSHSTIIVNLEKGTTIAGTGAAHAQSVSAVELETKSPNVAGGGSYASSSNIIELVSLSHSPAGGSSTAHSTAVVELSRSTHAVGTGAAHSQSVSEIELEALSHTTVGGGSYTQSNRLLELVGLSHATRTAACFVHDAKIIELLRGQSTVGSGAEVSNTGSIVELQPLTHISRGGGSYNHSIPQIELGYTSHQAIIGTTFTQDVSALSLVPNTHTVMLASDFVHRTQIVELAIRNHAISTGCSFAGSPNIVELVLGSHQANGGASYTQSISSIELETLRATLNTGQEAYLILSASTIDCIPGEHVARTSATVGQTPVNVTFVVGSHSITRLKPTIPAPDPTPYYNRPARFDGEYTAPGRTRGSYDSPSKSAGGYYNRPKRKGGSYVAPERVGGSYKAP